MKEEFTIGQRYLLKYKNNKNLNDIKVLQITPKSYKFRWYSTDNSYRDEWIIKSEFNKWYEIHENYEPIENEDDNEEIFSLERKNKTYKYFEENSIPCPVCLGETTIPDEKTTVGRIICPICWGSGRTWKT